jgi:purine-nucleoside phosphorylase
MQNPRSIGTRELHLIHLYSTWEFEMAPEEFYNKWEVTKEQIATICNCSDSTVKRWFRNNARRKPSFNDLRHLAMMDFLLEHFEEIPENVRQLLGWVDL